MINNLGSVHRDLDNLSLALSVYEQALAVLRQLGDRLGEASTLNNIGLVHLAGRNMAQALSIRREVGDKVGRRPSSPILDLCSTVADNWMPRSIL
jgi:hypothetical protein